MADWEQLPDEDGDGTPESIEDFAPAIAGTGTVQGDGNGDGTPDREQSEVASVPFRHTDKVTAVLDAPVVFVTLAAAGNNGNNNGDTPAKPIAKLRDVKQLDAPEDKPSDMEMPLGLISFYADLDAPGLIQNFSLLVDASAQVNGYWKQIGDGNWVNLASEAYNGSIKQVGNKWQLDFEIQDGSVFDDDGVANGVIYDPGALGYREPTALPDPISPFEGTNAHQFFDWMLLG
ncbi:hypothetical protein BTE48_11155 [Oceanospirillum multiglobuliferum]|uniref:Uncharacterized protein n=1 Tax=Oceanospirillum multiglobuliferum TaxID=64969 RepID=A0A1V4T4C6_9GAMM|nr:hypothetical protein BTE48_11155 [Oceanospirillum multiglobuliferum]